MACPLPWESCRVFNRKRLSSDKFSLNVHCRFRRIGLGGKCRQPQAAVLGSGKLAGQDNARSEDPFLLMILAALAVVLVTTLSQFMLDDIRRITAVAAWLHVWPIARMADIAGWFAELPAVGGFLIQPAIAAEELLWPAWSGNIDRTDWTIGQAAAGRVAMAFYGPILLRLAWRAGSNRPDLVFRRTHSLESLIKAQSAVWPVARIVRHFDGLEKRRNPEELIAEARQHSMKKQGSRQKTGSCVLCPAVPPFVPADLEIALRPETWLKAEGLASHNPEHSCRDAERTTDLTVELSNDWEHLTTDVISEVMEARLGLPWTGFANLRPVHGGLAAAFALCFSHMENEGRDLMTALAVLADRAASHNRSMDVELAGNRSVAGSINNALSGATGAEMRRIADRHAWQRTAMMGMLEAARKDRGVISTASFIWLKREDRILWHALNASGNAVAVAEAAAICAHYRAERQAGLPLRRPSVFQASRSLIRDYLDLENPRMPQRRASARERRPVGQKLAASAAGLRANAGLGEDVEGA